MSELQQQSGIDFTEAEIMRMLSAKFFTPSSHHVRGTLRMLPHVLSFIQGDRVEAFFNDEGICFCALRRQIGRNDAVEYVRNAFMLFTMMEVADRLNLKCFYDERGQRSFDLKLVL